MGPHRGNSGVPPALHNDTTHTKEPQMHTCREGDLGLVALGLPVLDHVVAGLVRLLAVALQEGSKQGGMNWTVLSVRHWHACWQHQLEYSSLRKCSAVPWALAGVLLLLLLRTTTISTADAAQQACVLEALRGWCAPLTLLWLCLR